MKMKELNYPEGSMLFDVKYHRKPECFEVIYFSPITNQLEVDYVDPIVDIWFLKEENRTNKYQISQVSIDQCYPVYCKPSQISKAIAENVGGEYKEYYDTYNGQISNKELKDKMCECPWVFKADFVPDVYFRLQWMNKYGAECDVSKVSFGLLDIEVDIIDRTIDPRDIYSAPQPVNAVSIILPHVKICAVLVLAPRPKHLIDERFHELLEKQQKEYDWLITHPEEMISKIIESDEDNKKYIGDYDIRLHTFDFDKEICLIKTIFNYINKYRPMFVMSWNAKFDDNYLIQRIAYLGYDPKKIIIPAEMKTDMLYYKEDTSKEATIKTSKDWLFASTYSTYICQMRLFAATRKSQQEQRSYSLSAIGRVIAKIDKLSNTKSGSFRTFAYTDFIKFILYNIRDVVVQLAIETICGDCRSLVSRSYMFATQYSKCFQETHIVRDCREYFFSQSGYTQACRLLIDPEAESSFKGAFVAPTEKNAPTGYVLNGKLINNILYGVMDADAKAYYPSNKMALNLDPMSLLYKCRIDNQVFAQQCSNKSFNQEYTWIDSKKRPHNEDMSGPMINSYKNKNISSVMYNWLGAPTISQYFEYIDANL